MDRRVFVTGLGLLAAAPLPVLAHPVKLPSALPIENDQEECLWVTARVLRADVPDLNGNVFTSESLIALGEDGLPVYKTLENVNVHLGYAELKENEGQKIIARVDFALWDEKNKALFATFPLRVKVYPELVKDIECGKLYYMGLTTEVEGFGCAYCGREPYPDQEVRECGCRATGQPPRELLNVKRVLSVHFIPGDSADSRCYITHTERTKERSDLWAGTRLREKRMSKIN